MPALFFDSANPQICAEISMLCLELGNCKQMRGKVVTCYKEAGCSNGHARLTYIEDDAAIWHRRARRTRGEAGVVRA